jgi:hypothetical protein
MDFEMDTAIPYDVIKKGTHLFRVDECSEDYENTDNAIASCDLVKSPAWFGGWDVATEDYDRKMDFALRTHGPLPRLYAFYVHTDIPLIALDRLDDGRTFGEWLNRKTEVEDVGTPGWFSNLVASICDMEQKHMPGETNIAIARGYSNFNPLVLKGGLIISPGAFLCEPSSYLSFKCEFDMEPEDDEAHVGVGTESEDDEPALDTDVVIQREVVGNDDHAFNLEYNLFSMNRSHFRDPPHEAEDWEVEEAGVDDVESVDLLQHVESIESADVLEEGEEEEEAPIRQPVLAPVPGSMMVDDTGTENEFFDDVKQHGGGTLLDDGTSHLGAPSFRNGVFGGTQGPLATRSVLTRSWYR